jgi:hypothetical protein
VSYVVKVVADFRSDLEDWISSGFSGGDRINIDSAPPV